MSLLARRRLLKSYTYEIMCLAIPGKLTQVQSIPDGMRMGKVNFGGIVKEVCIECTPEAVVGDYVLVHAGFALNIVNEAEALRTFELLKEMEQLDELTPGNLPDSSNQQGGHEVP